MVLLSVQDPLAPHFTSSVLGSCAALVQVGAGRKVLWVVSSATALVRP